MLKNVIVSTKMTKAKIIFYFIKNKYNKQFCI